ncbi:MAG TPA: formyltransferase family protein, partial [Longimicrobiales bacterium]|nr:formyltransferase family protein [Longimicrobiales bacterium]
YLLADPNRGRLYDLVACIGSEDALPPESRAVETTGVPFLRHPVRAFHRWMRAPLRDMGTRAFYDATMVALLEELRPDLVVLAGYLYVLTAPMLAAHADRIVNVHHSDLTRQDDRGRPRYPGLRAVRDAIVAGEAETRATAHFVTEEVDGGPLLLRSWAFPVARLAEDAVGWDAESMLKAYAFAHQEWMLRAAWGPMLARSIELVAQGRVEVQGGTAWIDGAPGPLELTAAGEVVSWPAYRPHARPEATN